MKYPPVWNMMVVLMVSEDETALTRQMEEMADYISNMAANDKEMKMIGPSIPVISKIKDIHRRVVYIKHNRYNMLVDIEANIEDYFIQINKDNKVNMMFDLNPMNMY